MMAKPRRIIRPGNSIRRSNQRNIDEDIRAGGYVSMYMQGPNASIHIDYLDDDSTPAPADALYVAVKNAGPLGAITVTKDNMPPGRGKNHFTTPPHNWSTHTPGAGHVAPGALTLTLVSGAGNVNVGLHNYVYTILTAGGESAPSPSASATVTGPARRVNVAGPSGDASTTGYRIYRTKIGGPSAYFLLNEIAGATFTAFVDNTADANLGAPL